MQPPKNSSIINICAIPADQISEACISISQPLKAEDTIFILGANKSAHLTLYMARFADTEIKKITNAVAQVIQRQDSFMCEQSGYFVTDGHYLEASYKKSADILKLHKDIIAAVSSFRLNPGTPFEESYFAPYTEEQRKNAEETGYDLANNLYRPHITLARYKSERAPTDLPNLPGESLSFKLDTVSVFRADENGSARELIKTYHLLK